ncbi:MAG TPA: F0F1 ATP synthase subunit B [Terriglobales bacterium]|nr:F0F1 ATP synthase subunit B [Terriglobales bacterium]
MDALSLLAMVESAGPVERIADTFGVDWPHLFAQIVSFCIVCFVLQRYAYKPVLQMLDQRRQRIAQELADSEKIKAELARTEAERQEVLLEANRQAAKFIEEARAAAARIGQQETQRAIAAAEQIIVKAREAAAQEQARMFAELKRDVGRLVLETASRVTGKILTAEDQRRLAEETARQLAPAA